MSSGRSIQSYVRRTGGCQQTSGLVSSGSRPSFRARMCSEQPAPPAKPGRFWKMHEPWNGRVCRSPSSSSETQPCATPSSWCCQTSGVSLATCSATRFSSSSSEKWAPNVQHPSSARPAWMPWRPLPKMQFQREVSHVRSRRKTCSSSAGSGNSTHARAKSRPFSSASRAFLDFFGAFACEEPWSVLAVLSFFAFFVFGTRPG
ncbi:hypothetical protein SALBM311S_07728 [Streptomyces alboniger]